MLNVSSCPSLQIPHSLSPAAHATMIPKLTCMMDDVNDDACLCVCVCVMVAGKETG